MSQSERWISRCLWRIHFGEFLRRSAEWLAVYFFSLGTVLLMTKLALGQLWGKPAVSGLNEYWSAVVVFAGVAAAGVVPILTGAWFFSRRPSYSRTEAVAYLDRRLSAGGLLMTLTESPDEEWQVRLPQVERLWEESLPRLWPTRFARVLAMPVAFVIATLFVPQREARTESLLQNTVGREAAVQLEEMLEQLDETVAIEEEEAKQLREEIEKLAEEAKHTPLTHEKWETVDSLSDRMRLRLESSTMELSKGMDAIDALLDAQATNGQELSPERLDQLTKDMIETLQKMGRKNNGKGFEGLSPEVREQLQRLMKNQDLKLPEDAEEREQLLKELKEHLDQEFNELAELRKQFQKSGEGTCPSCGSKMSNGQCSNGNCPGGQEGECKDGNCSIAGHRHSNRPGRGGVTEGRGDAPLTWGDESDKQGSKFREVVLPKGTLDDPTDQTIRVTLTDPDVDPASAAPRTGNKSTESASGKETWNRTVRPRHRNVVRRYFDSE